MKKSILFLLAVGMFAFTSCGPSAEEKAAAEKAKADSIIAVENARIQDSLATAQQAAQEAEAMALKATEDSLKMKATEDSLAAEKAKSTKKTTIKKATTPKVAAAPKATLTEEEKLLPAKTQEKILKKRQQMLDDAAKNK
jgi:hypothetical protein